MKLQQLRFLVAIAKHNLNISEAAEHLYTSQPGVSKQIKLLEDELGVELFHRSGKHLVSVTKAGQDVISRAEDILGQVHNIKSLTAEYRDHKQGQLAIATTHTQARYTLPDVINQFRNRYPDVDLHLHQGTPRSISEMAVSGNVDFAIATEAIALYSDLVMMPAYHWNRVVVVPQQHPLAQQEALTLETLTQYPMVTYIQGLTGRSQMDQAFQQAKLTPNLVFTATDADVIKTYVRLGMGIGLIARMAYLPALDQDLVALDVSHLFAESTTKVAFRRGTYLRRYYYDFLELFASHLTQDRIDAAAAATNQASVDALFADVELAVR